jgi:c-di-AMP phosphodiesterase-like protein
MWSPNYKQNKLRVTAPCPKLLDCDNYYNSPPPTHIHTYEYFATTSLNMFCFHVLICFQEHKARIYMLNLHVLGYLFISFFIPSFNTVKFCGMCLRQTRAQNTATMDQSLYVNPDVLITFNTSNCIMFYNEKVTSHFSTNITKNISYRQPAGKTVRQWEINVQKHNCYA